MLRSVPLFVLTARAAAAQMKYYTHRQLCDCIAHGEASESEVAQVRSPRPAFRRSIRCRPAVGTDFLYPKVTPRKQ